MNALLQYRCKKKRIEQKKKNDQREYIDQLPFIPEKEI
jgi:hypothetical protein